MNNLKITILLLCFHLQMHYVMCRKYTNYTLFRGIPVNQEHLNFLRNFTDSYKVDFWKPPGKVNGSVDFLMGPENKASFLKDVEVRRLYLTTVIEDVQGAFEKQTVKQYIRRKMDSFNWYSYFRLKDIYAWIRDLVRSYPEELTLQRIGLTEERRELLAVRLALKGSKLRSKVIVEGGIHAREWISISFVTYMLNELVKAPASEDKALYDIALTYEWYFVPVMNPDGYEYSHTQDRLWRKNLRDGHGVDLNRNFEVAFGTVGVSYSKTSDTYCGKGPLSERETSAMAAFIESKSDKLEYYLAFHAYGQYLILPFAHSKKHLGNYYEMLKIGQEATSAIHRRYGTNYAVGTAYDTVGYMTSGVSGCWVKSAFQVPYVATFELRDEGHYGFALPPEQILPTCKETMDGVISLLTPRSRYFRKPNKLNDLELKDGQKSKVSDKIVVVFNILLFIIVRFD